MRKSAFSSLFQTGRKRPIALGFLFCVSLSHVSSAQKAYISNSLSGTVSVLDTSTEAFCTTGSCASNAIYPIRVGDAPTQIVMSQDSLTAYVFNTGSSSISVIDTSRDVVKDTIPLPVAISKLSSFFVLPDQSAIYALDGEAGTTVYSISTQSHAVIASIQVVYPFGKYSVPYLRSAAGFVMSLDGAYLYVLTFGNCGFEAPDSLILTFSTASNSIISPQAGYYNYQTLCGAGLSISPDGSKLYAGHGPIDVVPISTQNTTATISAPSLSTPLTISGSGSFGYSTDYTNHLLFFDLGTNSLAGSLGLGNGPRSLALTGDGRSLYVINSQDRSISVVDTAKKIVLSTLTGLDSPAGIAIQASSIPAQNGELLGPDGCGCVSQTGTAGAGEPIDVASGNMGYEVADYTTSGANSLSFRRVYNSRATSGGLKTLATTLGPNWRSNFDKYIQIRSASQIVAERASGKQYVFNKAGSGWNSNGDVDITIINSGTRWTLTDTNDTVEVYTTSSNGAYAQLNSITARNGYEQSLAYDRHNQLQSITDSYGRNLTFSYSSGLLTAVYTPEGNKYVYIYASNGTLQYAASPIDQSGGATYSYLYEIPTQPTALTGVLDRYGERINSWGYDPSGRGTSSSQGGSALTANLTTIVCDDVTGNRQVTNALGVVDTYSFQTFQNVPKIVSINRAATSTTPAMKRLLTYDMNGYMSSQTDWNGNLTKYTSDVHGSPLILVEASGSPVERTTTIKYDTTFVHLPATIDTPGLSTRYTYDILGNPLKRLLSDTTSSILPYPTRGQTRQWLYRWSNGLPTAITTPEGNFTSFTYSSGGALTSVTNALGQTMFIIANTAGGYPIATKDLSGVLTTINYDKQMRQTTKVIATGAGPLTYTTNYWFGDLLSSVLQPDYSVWNFIPDAALRLSSGGDGLNRFDYTLDRLGDRTQTTYSDPNKNVTYIHSATFDALGRKLTDIGTAGQVTTYSYDNNGNEVSTTDGLGYTTIKQYDALNRLVSSIDTSGGRAIMTYDAHDRPLTVRDPIGNITRYVYDGFGEAIQQASPDSGTTIYTYRKDGVGKSKTDAAGNVTNQIYDPLDRIVETRYPGDPTLNISYSYDEPGHGFSVGRLTSMTDAAGKLSRTYDERGNILSEQRIIDKSTILTTSYTYDKASRISSITYPSGATSSYKRDGTGHVTQMPFAAQNSDQSYSVFSVGYLPFGPLKAIGFNNGDKTNFIFDQSYRQTLLEYDNYQNVPYFHWNYKYDQASNVSSITDGIKPANGQTFSYDPLNRLTSAVSNGTYGSMGFSYDANGNLINHIVGSQSYVHGYKAGTNRLSTITQPGFNESIDYTPTGNLKSFTINGALNASLAYSKAGRLTSVVGSSVNVALVGATYDAFGKRISKTDAGSKAILYSYDLNGNLIEENDGGVTTDYIYLDNLNVANWSASEHHLYALNTDRLGVPVVGRDEYGLTSWAAYSQPYGAMTATVTGGLFTGPVTQNLRLPGQYHDNEIGFHYNGFRDYIPGFGRYLEADPIGLAGGLNPYQYVNGRPGRFTDSGGLLAIALGSTIGGGIYITKSRSTGMVIDLNGDYGTYVTTASGATGAEGLPINSSVAAYLNINLQAIGSTSSNSPPTDINSFAGPFINGSISGGADGLGGSFDLVQDPDHPNIVGGGLSGGLSLPGVSAAIQISNTCVTARGNVYTNLKNAYSSFIEGILDVIELFPDIIDNP